MDIRGADGALVEKLNLISDLKKGLRDYPTVAALRRAARRDADAFDEALSAAGYYLGATEFTVQRFETGEKPLVIFTVETGPKFRITEYEILYRDEGDDRPQTLEEAGVRADGSAACFRPDGEDTTHLVLGLQGLAPYWWEVDAAAFLSTDGNLTARVEAEYDQRITQRLILQPRMEIDVSASDIPELEIGSGLSSVEAGLRLRYEFRKEFAPYVGVEWSRAFGDTADYIEARGGEAEDTRLVVGLKAWF